MYQHDIISFFYFTYNSDKLINSYTMVFSWYQQNILKFKNIELLFKKYYLFISFYFFLKGSNEILSI